MCCIYMNSKYNNILNKAKEMQSVYMYDGNDKEIYDILLYTE